MHKFRGPLVSLVVLLVLVFWMWAADFVTLEGERTIYTVACEQGEWKDDHCTGRLVAAARHRFRALRPHREVLYWVVGSPQPSGRFDGCQIRDGRNWICQGPSGTSITREMRMGEAVHDPAATAFHAVPKWRWMLLRLGLPVGSSAA